MNSQGCNTKTSSMCMNSNMANSCFDNACFCGKERECEGNSKCREPDQTPPTNNSPTATCQYGE